VGSEDEVEEVLQGGVANAGAVVRIGDEVRRPANPHTATIHALLRHVRARGCDLVPEPLGVDDRDRDRLRFVRGDVAVPPFPAWSQTDAWLASTALAIRGLHDASVDFVAPAGASWSDELADTSGVHEVICHNDVCPENVVCRDGLAVALLDFDFAAPGRRVHDLAAFACMCVPLAAEVDATMLGRGPLDPFHRLRVVADGYGLDPDRAPFVDAIAEWIERGGEFVLRHVQAGEPAFIQMWEETGGMARYDRRRAWFVQQRERLAEALG
jgi:Phosphotransferase enzyme family